MIAKEQLIVLLLNTRYNIDGYSLVSMGSINESIAHPREVFRPAVWRVLRDYRNAQPPERRSFALAVRPFTYPPTREAAELLQIKLLDHVVVGRRGDLSHSGYFSFKEAGVL
jgi:DNA repair protein RadC